MPKLIQKFSGYEDFVDHIEQFSTSLLGTGGSRLVARDKAEMHRLLNGANAKAVSTFVDETFRKDYGVFFTCEYLANKVAKRLKRELEAGAKVLDPACGSADLLIACSKYLPLRSTFAKTLKYWSSLLHGFDIYPDFIRSARHRLILSVIEKQKNVTETNGNYFGKLLAGDFFENSESLKKVDYIVANPPYGHVDLTRDVSWGSGKGQLAAVFIDEVIKCGRNGQRVVAVLPDVLRSGSRYQKWRDFLNQNATDVDYEVFGRFNSEADVDVFILDFVIDKSTEKVAEILEDKKRTKDVKNIGDLFSVSVGPVVPYRQKLEKQKKPYIDAGNTPLWKELVSDKKCNYACTLKKPPFFVVRRTSGPHDYPRAKASLIKGNTEIAVENHLIVLRPNDGTLQKCRSLMKYLKSDEVTNILNEKIRCRHLTVGVIAGLPWICE